MNYTVSTYATALYLECLVERISVFSSLEYDSYA